jgi:hypothetical protein
LGVVFLLFLASVMVRYDNLTAALGRHHEWITAHALMTINMLEKDGASAHYFAPVLTFNTPADRFAASKAEFKDKNNFTYYTSYPPFCFLLPYLVNKCFGLSASVIGIRILGLIVHLLCTVLLFFIFYRINGKDVRKEIFIPAFFVCAIYIFSSGNLWFHSNLWFADMLVHLFILAALQRFCIIMAYPGIQKKNVILLFLFTFLGIYTEWLALFMCFFMAIVLLIRLKEHKTYGIYIVTMAGAASLSLGLTIFQYSQIAGFELLKKYAIEKFKFRSGYDTDQGVKHTVFADEPLENIFFNYHVNYKALILLSISVLVIALVLRFTARGKEIFSFTRIQKIVLLILLCSILLHHLLFFNFTSVHDFSTLKTALFLSLFLPLLIVFIQNSLQSVKFQAVSVAVILLFIVFSVKWYLSFNPLNNAFIYQRDIGQDAKNYAVPDEMVYSNAPNTPVISWYASRNVYFSKSLEQTVEFLQKLNYKQALFVDLVVGDQRYVTRVYRVTIYGQVEVLKKGSL